MSRVLRCTRCRLSGLFSEFGPAGIEGIAFVLGGVEFFQSLFERGGVCRDLGLLNPFTGGVQAGV